MRPDPTLPALTSAEADLVDHYLAVVDRIAVINPARDPGHTYTALRAAQALVVEATALRDALGAMFERGEREIYADTLTRAMRALGGERRSVRVAIPAPAPPPAA